MEAQFILNGSATIITPQCSSATTTYQLTPDLGAQAGEIWYATQISLANRFDIQFQVFLGTKDYYGGSGADGVCFVFQQQSTNAGSAGGGMGFGGITPSVGVEFDTYENGWDPAFCHTAIEKNGDVNHTDGSGNNLAGPVQLSSTNPDLPDGAWHSIEIIWDPITKKLSEYCDCVFRLSYTGDIVSTVFGGNPNVYWGFTAGTGGASNLQEICITHSYLTNNLRDTLICSGNSVPLTVSGGVSYSWSPAAGLSSTTTASVTATPATTTSYTVSITNNCGLISRDSATITVNPNPVVTVNSTAICAGTNATLTGNGATAYSWSTGSITNPITVIPATTTTYTLTGTTTGCTGTAIATVTVNVLPTITVNSATICAGTGATLTGVGPAGTTYSWSTGATTNPITVSPASTTSYTVTGTDANGCTGSAVATVTVGSTLSITASSPSICSGSSISLSASGGTTYSWSTGSTTNPITVTPLTTTTYTVTGTSSTCSGSATVTVTVDVLKATAAGFPATCNGSCNGYAVVIPSGGTLPYTYLWTPGGNTTANANNLCAGNYCIKVSDANGCSIDTCVIITEPTALNVSIPTSSNDSCNRLCDGTATGLTTGGTAPYTYSWNTVPVQTTAEAISLCAGTYTLTANDAAGCSSTASVTITQPTQITVTPSAATTICIGQSTTISSTASGGTPAYTYSWNAIYNGQNYTVSPTSTPITYTVIANDANGCKSTPQTVTVSLNPPLNVIAKSDTSLCIGGHATLNAIATGGNGNYNYVWQPGAFSGSTISLTPITTTIYTVTVTDNCGTPSDSSTVTVKVNPLPTASFSADTTSGCYPLCVTFTNLSTPPSASATWEFGDGNSATTVGSASYCYQTAGQFSVSLAVKDSLGCSNSTTIGNLITVYPHPTANFNMSPNPVTILVPTVYFTDESTGGVTQWEWNMGDVLNSGSTKQNPQYTYPDTGYYNVQLIVTDIHGCTDSISKTVYIEGQYVIYVPNAFTPNGDGINDTFYPKGTGIDPNNYQMYIFDRWGNLIFNTTHLSQGWDGTEGGKLVQQGVYVWKIVAKDFLGNNHQYIGHVSVVR